MNKRPRISVFRSNKYIYAQIIDDQRGVSLVSASEAQLKKEKKSPKTKRAELVGKILAEKAIKKGIKKVRFDRRKYKYHGRVKALAERAKKGGLKF